ncbi:helix-turn-helix domain-containing protein [Bartonella sp. ML70XJBT]|nr:helix-turn-helix domain-containing protein [Bartonella sp. ML70XJBT]
MRDSGNFKRYSVRSRDHGTIAACGIDLMYSGCSIP